MPASLAPIRCHAHKRAIQHTFTYLDTGVLLGNELVRADGRYGHIGLQQGGMLEEEGQGVHATERGAHYHHWVQFESLTHLLQEGSRGQLPHRHWGRSSL